MDTQIETEITQHNLIPAAHTGAYDIRHNSVDKHRPPAERIRNYLDSVGDPYHFIVGETVVHIRFNGEKSLTACLADTLNRMAG